MYKIGVGGIITDHDERWADVEIQHIDNRQWSLSQKVHIVVKRQVFISESDEHMELGIISFLYPCYSGTG